MNKILLMLMCLLSSASWAAEGDVGGYLRVMTRGLGGDGPWEYWNLYGRLLNEGPFVALETQLHLLRQEPGSDEVWTLIHGRIEGGSVGNADLGNGRLDNMRLTQLYVQAGNVVLPGVTWQVGTLQTWMGDLGLYDMRPSTLFDDTVGLSGHWQKDKIDVLVGLEWVRSQRRTIQHRHENECTGATRATVGDRRGRTTGMSPKSSAIGSRPSTPDISYEDWLRQGLIRIGR